MPRTILHFTIGKTGHRIAAVNMSSLETYVKHIEDICGTAGRYFRITDEYESSSICVVSYPNVPEEGCTTAFSFGLSSVPHEEWRNSRPELVISVNSLDTAWPLAMGELIRNGRDQCLFSYGMILNFGQKIVEESEMTCFLVFACTVVEDSDSVVELEDRKVHFSQLYPIHHSETGLIKDVGVERFFFDLGIDFFDVKRMPHQ
jgi:hypothetical protein